MMFLTSVYLCWCCS